jgi:hypothetical protein
MSKNLALRVSQIREWGSNQKKLASAENPKVGGENIEGNNGSIWNNKWRLQMLPAHPQT